MIEHDKLVSEYQDAIRSMRDGRFNLSVSADLGDKVGKLGFDLNDLAQELERKFNGKVMKVP